MRFLIPIEVIKSSKRKMVCKLKKNAYILRCTSGIEFKLGLTLAKKR